MNFIPNHFFPHLLILDTSRSQQGSPSNCILKIPPCVFPVRRQIFTYTKLTWQTYQFEIFQQILKYLLLLESGNLQREQTKFPVFWQNFQIPCVFPDRDFFGGLFSLFSLCSRYPVTVTSRTYETRSCSHGCGTYVCSRAAVESAAAPLREVSSEYWEDYPL